MRRYRKQQLLIIASLLIAITSLSVGFAAFSTTLKLSSIASVSPDSDTFSVRFSTTKDILTLSEVVPSNKTPNLITTNGIINNMASPVISNLSATFTEPGQYAEYTFYARNEGEYTAYLNNINFLGEKTCTGDADATPSLVESACNAITMSVTVGSTTYTETTEVSNHALNKNTGEEIKVKLNYDSAGARTDGSFQVYFAKVVFIYSTIDDKKYSPPSKGPTSSNLSTLYTKMLRSITGTDENMEFGTEEVEDGLFMRHDTGNANSPIIYYRGNVDNNNVIFANYCWKIVRTTETGGVKLVYNGTPTDNKCFGEDSIIGNSEYNVLRAEDPIPDDVRYIYADGTDSTIKTTIESWYEDNMLEYTSKLEDTPWCNDRSIYSDTTKDGERYIEYGAMGRLFINAAPSLACDDKYALTVSSTNLENRLKYPIGLLTADELSFAGYSVNSILKTNYLTNGSFWWTMTPGEFYVSETKNFYSIKETSHMFCYHNHVAFGVRPAVSLAPNTKVSSGDGTANTPYIIE